MRCLKNMILTTVTVISAVTLLFLMLTIDSYEHLLIPCFLMVVCMGWLHLIGYANGVTYNSPYRKE